MANKMVVITDLVTLEQFMQHAIRTLGGIDIFRTLSIGQDGISEMATIFESDARPGNIICTFQVSETTIGENGAGASLARYACTVMVMHKSDGKAQTLSVKMDARNRTWKKTLRLIGLIREAAEWYAQNVDEVEGEHYEVTFDIFQNRILPVGKIANANVQGWLVDIDITIPVNKLMYE